MSNPRDGMKYFMPLTKGHPNDGPTRSVFSVPQVQYSPQTEAVVKSTYADLITLILNL